MSQWLWKAWSEWGTGSSWGGRCRVGGWICCSCVNWLEEGLSSSPAELVLCWLVGKSLVLVSEVWGRRSSWCLLCLSWKLCKVYSGSWGYLRMEVSRRYLITINLAKAPNPSICAIWALWWSKQERQPSISWAHYTPEHHKLLKTCHPIPSILFVFIFFSCHFFQSFTADEPNYMKIYL